MINYFMFICRSKKSFKKNVMKYNFCYKLLKIVSSFEEILNGDIQMNQHTTVKEELLSY